MTAESLNWFPDYSENYWRSFNQRKGKFPQQKWIINEEKQKFYWVSFQTTLTRDVLKVFHFKLVVKLIHRESFHLLVLPASEVNDKQFDLFQVNSRENFLEGNYHNFIEKLKPRSFSVFCILTLKSTDQPIRTTPSRFKSNQSYRWTNIYKSSRNTVWFIPREAGSLTADFTWKAIRRKINWFLSKVNLFVVLLL